MLLDHMVDYETFSDEWAEQQVILRELAREAYEAEASANGELSVEPVEPVKPERCIECGRLLDAFTPPGLAEDGLCSSRCWAWFSGEID